MTDNEVNRLQDKILEDIGRRLTQERDDRKEDYREITRRLDKIETKLEETLNYCHNNGGMLTGKLSLLKHPLWWVVFLLAGGDSAQTFIKWLIGN